MSLLECYICLEEYGKNDNSEKAPKILSCGHTICCKCIKQKMKKDNGQIICPFDMKKDNRIFEEIPFNRIIYDIILESKSIKRQVESKEKFDLSLKIGMIGNSYTGKTSILNCYQDNRPSLKNDFYLPTLYCEFYKRIINVNGKKIKTLVYDTNGAERFNSITSGYLRNLHGCFIVFDTTNFSSFQDLDNWIKLYRDYNK